jgi:hypothetical protein
MIKRRKNVISITQLFEDKRKLFNKKTIGAAGLGGVGLGGGTVAGLHHIGKKANEADRFNFLGFKLPNYDTQENIKRGVTIVGKKISDKFDGKNVGKKISDNIGDVKDKLE